MGNEVKEKGVVRFPRNLDELQEFYRKRLIETDNQIELVMTRFNSFDTNRCKPMMVERSTIDKIVKRYGSNGLLYIISWNPNADIQENDVIIRNIQTEIKKSPYKYLPIFVGYNEWKQNQRDNFGLSFIVFNCDRDYKSQDWQKLSEFGTQLYNKSNHITILKKVNDLSQEILSHHDEDMFSFIVDSGHDCYVNPSPCTRNEEIFRHSTGEIIVMRQLFEEWINS